MEKRRKFFIKTFGCQANLADSEKIKAYLVSAGMVPVDKMEEADWIIINSCAVRQSAENRAYGLVRNLQKLKEKRPHLKIILTGCVLYHPLSYLKPRALGVDFWVKKDDWSSFIFSRLGKKVSPSFSKRETVLMDDGFSYTLLPIMEGCNNFCSYCVVPYARGREVSYPLEEIICQAKKLARDGYPYILLLGQNVNSYRPRELSNQKEAPFATLLRLLHRIEAVKRIAFLSSNPWDLTDDIIEAMSLPKISRYFHLPVQSGDDEVLRRMNRKYTALHYIKLVEKIRKKIPDIKISTDIIVGFPGESEKQFQNTVSLVKKVGFYKAYINKYSPRPGTVAARFPDNVPIAEKKRRWQILDNLINQPYFSSKDGKASH